MERLINLFKEMTFDFGVSDWVIVLLAGLLGAWLVFSYV